MSILIIDGVQFDCNVLIKLFPELQKYSKFLVDKYDNNNDEDDDYEEFHSYIWDLINQWCLPIKDNKIIKHNGWCYNKYTKELFYINNFKKDDKYDLKNNKLYKTVKEGYTRWVCEYVNINKNKDTLLFGDIEISCSEYNIVIIDKEIKMFSPPCCSEDNLNKYYIGYMIDKIDIIIFNTTPELKSTLDISLLKEIWTDFPNINTSLYISSNECMYC